MGHRDDIVDELRKLFVDVEYTEKSHFAAAENLRVIHYALGGTAAVASAAASAVFVKSNSPMAASVLALVATLAATLLTFLNPQGSAEQHVTCARELGDLKRRIRQCQLLDGHPDSGRSDDDLRSALIALTAEKRETHQGTPTTGSLAFRRAQRKMNAGHFDYDGEATGLNS